MPNISLRRTANALFVLAATVLLLSSTPRPAAADPVVIESGFLFASNNTIQGFGLDFALHGDGFSFVQEHGHERDYLIGFTRESFRLVFSPSEAMASCAGCPSYGGDFFFSAGAPVPSAGDWAPFTMQGTIDVYGAGSTEPLRHELMGSGRMIASSDGPASVLYEFQSAAAPAPVPEPGSLLLVGAGAIAGLAKRLRSNRRASRSARN